MFSNKTTQGSWLEKINQWFSKTKNKLSETKVKERLEKLEVEQSKEKKGLAEQRRFYERLFSKSKSVPQQAVPLKTENRPIPVPPPPVSLRPDPVFTVSKDKPLVHSVNFAHPEEIVSPIPATEINLKPSTLTVPVPPTHNLAVPVPSTHNLKDNSTGHNLSATPSSKSPHPVPPPPPPPTPVSLETSSKPSPHLLVSLKSKFFRANHRKEGVSLEDRNAIEKRSWEPYDAIKPNLIKNQEVLFFNWHENLLVLGLSLVMCCLAISLVYVGLLIWQKEKLDANRITLLNARAMDDKIVKTEKEVREIKAFNMKLLTVSSLLDNHIYWTNYLSFLENATLKDVYYKRFSGDLSGEYNIPAVARNLEAVSLQLEVMKGYDEIKSITPDTGTSNELDNTVPFDLGMSIDPLIFTK
ncbi:MAG TPA: hypothetical protein PK720_04080 [bacterium]|nr:hypothetical protein [bacterium]